MGNADDNRGRPCRFKPNMIYMIVWHYVWWYGDVYDDVTLYMMIAHYVWCDTMYDDVTLWWCDTTYDDVTGNADDNRGRHVSFQPKPLRQRQSLPLYPRDLVCIMMWHYAWWCDTMYDHVTLCMMMWHVRICTKVCLSILGTWYVTSSYIVSHHHA